MEFSEARNVNASGSFRNLVGAFPECAHRCDTAKLTGELCARFARPAFSENKE
jgi:hypothetical protein